MNYMVALMPLFVADFAACWDEQVVASDAAPHGMGMCSTDAETSRAVALVRWEERWRYRRIEPHE